LTEKIGPPDSKGSQRITLLNCGKSCYDRIVHYVFNGKNASKQACICVFGTLQALMHAISTINGTSKDAYEGTL